MQKAMAEIATVMINAPNIVVTYDDVRALFGKGKQKDAENSREDRRASLPALRKTGRSTRT